MPSIEVEPLAAAVEEVDEVEPDPATVLAQPANGTAKTAAAAIAARVRLLKFMKDHRPIAGMCWQRYGLGSRVSQEVAVGVLWVERLQGGVWLACCDGGGGAIGRDSSRGDGGTQVVEYRST